MLTVRLSNMLRRYRSHESRHTELSSFCQQQYKWRQMVGRISGLDAKQYRIVRAVHASDSVNVFHACHLPTNHTVVIKLTDLDLEDSLDSVIHEANTLRKLRHSNIVPFLTAFVYDNYLWKVVACAEYGSVDQWSRPNGLPEMAIAFIVKDVLLALSYLHKRGIIHRAICGPHILVNSHGQCMLTGFKYSTSVLQKGRWQPTIHQYPSNSLKLLNYLAPEILQQNLAGYNSKSDIYSVGIVCCELANGCVPFEDIELTEMLLDKLTGSFPRPLDSTCDEIRNFPTDDEGMSLEVKEKYNLYMSRTFSASFHKFTVEQCLEYNIIDRPTAAQLLNHNFIKQIKKCHQTLIDLLQNCNNEGPLKNTKSSDKCNSILSGTQMNDSGPSGVSSSNSQTVDLTHSLHNKLRLNESDSQSECLWSFGD